MPEADLDLGTALTGASADMFAQISPALTAAIPVALAVLAVTIGWRVFKRFARG